MKVLLEGRKDVMPWWVGQCVRCGDCGRMVKLEAGDHARSAWMPTQSGTEVVVFCETCAGVMKLKRMFKARSRRVEDVRAKFAHLDRVLRQCATCDDPIYRTAAELWEAITGPNDRLDRQEEAR